MTKPIIGLNADYRRAQQNQPAFSAITAGYYDSLQRAGAIAVVVPPTDNEHDLNSLFDRLDGFVFVGGADLDPRRDGFMLHPTVKPMEARREIFDRMCMRLIAARRMPVFGIGVGMQLLNVTLGGTLYLHIPEDLPEAIPHKDLYDPDHRHSLVVKAGSIMEKVYGEGDIRVTSRHHMAIDDVAPEFDVTARCPDGVIEAIESNRPDWVAIGTQFHPESRAASAMDCRIFEEFVEAIANPNPVVSLKIAA
ncbi:MAG TPA: gamma-glutamyl-gamma-aminobutyrate hydrolase family protein [Pirellulaceae bacterium]|nr:gamma-glutamyl-gamma-aminobutyrate hydrolase family protein [Pirellulaceae bacterium]HMO92573.1 gamma-glutamyl-gamma-aminobutyrate hydrolase family protein [Pirellulaceae bacterium]HMP70629.1 gamma-glutamyl-gamma-aminobutyrate hydrolase family protein [Pirellulaceae bacterium]